MDFLVTFTLNLHLTAANWPGREAGEKLWKISVGKAVPFTILQSLRESSCRHRGQKLARRLAQIHETDIISAMVLSSDSSPSRYLSV